MDVFAKHWMEDSGSIQSQDQTAKCSAKLGVPHGVHATEGCLTVLCAGLLWKL